MSSNNPDRHGNRGFDGIPALGQSQYRNPETGDMTTVDVIEVTQPDRGTIIVFEQRNPTP